MIKLVSIEQLGAASDKKNFPAMRKTAMRVTPYIKTAAYYRDLGITVDAEVKDDEHVLTIPQLHRLSKHRPVIGYGQYVEEREPWAMSHLNLFETYCYKSNHDAMMTRSYGLYLDVLEGNLEFDVLFPMDTSNSKLYPFEDADGVRLETNSLLEVPILDHDKKVATFFMISEFFNGGDFYDDNTSDGYAIAKKTVLDVYFRTLDAFTAQTGIEWKLVKLGDKTSTYSEVSREDAYKQIKELTDRRLDQEKRRRVKAQIKYRLEQESEVLFDEPSPFL